MNQETAADLAVSTPMTLSAQARQLLEPLEQLIESNSIEIPMLPEVANKALILAQNPDSDASEMARLIQSDQSLAGHMMRIANSVAYTPMANLVSLQQAIARLGMGVISEIALAASVGAKFFNTPGYESHVANIWSHALATALWAKEIARHCRSNVEVSFLAGLLHSIGRPATIQAMLELAKKQTIALTEDEVLQLEQRYSQQVTQAVVEAWKMPALVIEAVSYYDGFKLAPNAVTQAALVNAGTVFASHMLDSEKLNRETLMKSPAMAALNLYQDEIETLLSQTEVVKGRLEGLRS